jgi:hypothetical protein
MQKRENEEKPSHVERNGTDIFLLFPCQLKPLGNSSGETSIAEKLQPLLPIALDGIEY